VSDGVTRVHIDLRGIVLDMEGAEEFVRAELPSLRDAILAAFKSQPVEVPPALDAKDAKEETVVNDRSGQELARPISDRSLTMHFGVSQEELNQIIHLDGTSIHILRTPSGSKAEQQRALCLLYCLAREYLAPGEGASFVDLRKLCQDHGCLDDSNFAQNLTKEKSKFIVSGSKRSKAKTCKLTQPGMTEARQLLKQMVGTKLA